MSHGRCRSYVQVPTVDLLLSLPLLLLRQWTSICASQPEPRIQSLPCGDALDKQIWTLAMPAFINFLILPITGAVDLFFIGQLGSALAAAGQARPARCILRRRC